MLGVQKRAATEFTFWLAMPTMLGAFTLDFWKNRSAFDSHQTLLIAIGLVAAFVAALLVIRQLVNFVGRHGFAPFAYCDGTKFDLPAKTNGEPCRERLVPACGSTVGCPRCIS